nr:MFS transporter [Rhodospirillales bacterium]
VVALACGTVGVTALLVPFCRRTDRATDHRGGRGQDGSSGWLQPILALLRIRPLRRMVTASLAYAAMQLCLGAFLTVYLVERQGLPLADAGLVFGISQAGSAVGRLLWGYVADRLCSPLMVFILLGIGMAASAALVADFTPAWPLWGMALVAAVYGATAMGWNGVLLAEVARLAPPGQTRALTGAVMSVNFFGVLIGPLLFTAVLRLTGRFEAGFLFMALFVLIGTGTAAASLRGNR